jgi:histidyl-tRNA synthetase
MERLPGFRDWYPEPLPRGDVWSAAARQYVFDRWREVARRYGFREYDGPPLESLELFTAKSGDEIVGQLYNFIDKGERAVSLRPEMTPTLVRMVAAHERNYKKPIKWFAMPQLFRYERQQKGRLREHFQFNADIIGEADPAADAEIVALLIDSLRGLNLTADDFVIRLSSRQAWQHFFSERCNDADQAYAFFQIIDKLEREDPSSSRAKLQQLGIDFDDVTRFIAASRPTAELQRVLDNLTARGLGDFVQIDYNVIRGLAYYTGVVFEAFDKRREFRAIAGGGRYDGLFKVLSGGKTDLPALGFGMGDVVLQELLAARGLLPKFDAAVDVFCLIEDESLRSESLQLITDLRAAGKVVEYSFTALKSDKQFKRAVEMGAAHSVKIERSPGGDLTARIRNLSSREERVVSVADVVDVL